MTVWKDESFVVMFLWWYDCLGIDVITEDAN